MIFQAQRIDNRRCDGFSPLPPPIMPIDMNWVSSVSERSRAMRRIEVRAGTELDVSCAVLHPVHDRHVGGYPEIAGDVEHPQPSPGIRKLGFQIPDVGIVELPEVELGTLQPVVPPDGVGIALDQFEEALNDGFLAGVAGRAAVGVGMEKKQP